MHLLKIYQQTDYENLLLQLILDEQLYDPNESNYNYVQFLNFFLANQ